MSRWFPEVDDHEGVRKALNAGFYAALAFAAMNLLGIAYLFFANRLPGLGQPQSFAGAVIGMIVELGITAVAAWRFKIGKGLVWGAIIFLLFVVEIIVKIVSGTAGVASIFFYAVIGAGLVNGIRGAWAARSLPPGADYAKVFE